MRLIVAPCSMRTLAAIVAGTVARLLDLVGVDLPGAKRWGSA